MNALEIKGLKKSFGTQLVIDDLSFQIPEHSVFGFLGQNGAGKTTTMKIILGLLKADEGEIRVFDEVVTYGKTKTNRYIGYLPDVPEFYGYMRPKEYLALCGEITGLNERQIAEKSKELLELVGLSGVNKRIAGFSRGMKQRLGIAQALLSEPRLLICDEPTSALDPLGRKEILDILERVKDKTTVLFSTHILSDVERICDKIAVLHEGNLVLQGSLEELKAQRRCDSLLVAFASQQELQNFVELQEIKEMQLKTEIRDAEIIFHTTEGLANIQKLILEILYKNNLLPIKFEVLEPNLESLFMEVIR